MKRFSLLLIVLMVVGIFHTGVSKLRQKERKASVAVEFLTFRVDPSSQEDFFRKDSTEWTGKLEDQRSFIKKEIWKDQNDISLVHMVIYWQAPVVAEDMTTDPEFMASELFDEEMTNDYLLIGSRYYLTEKNMLLN
ncbi:TIGR03792 family protein [Roseivirga sp. BDSF3-8]|uniref:TIGR03792 family protein n=1 Tax=Roseivirga sp. BDSF3-8 TaxID=3241598 RepID=UPI0035327A82